MNNLAYKQMPEYKYVKKAFIEKGFEEDIIDSFLLLNLVYSDDNVKDKIKSLEDKLIAFEAECRGRFDKIDDKFDKIDDKFDKIDDKFDKVNTKIEAVRNELSSEIKEVRNELNGRIDKLDDKIDTVRNELKSELSSKIDSAIKPLYWIFGFVSTFAVSAVIGLFIHYLSK